MTIHFLNTKPHKVCENVDVFDASILNHISVTKPYFALKNFKNAGEYIYAEFTTELINVAEEGPIGGAEVGRHMAILGSVVLSKENQLKERHYYLATDAIIKRCSCKTSTNYDLSCRAKMVLLNRKKGIVHGEIFDQDGSILYKVEVSYMVLGKNIFERMFAQYRVDTDFDVSFNPYINDSQFIDLKLGIQSCYASIGVVKKEDCVGHFRNFPALPVARMGTSMGKIAGMHFMHLNPSEKQKYMVSHAEIHARQLVFTGEEVKFRTEIIDPKPEKGMVIKTIAFSDQYDYIAESIANYHY